MKSKGYPGYGASRTRRGFIFALAIALLFALVSVSVQVDYNIGPRVDPEQVTQSYDCWKE